MLKPHLTGHRATICARLPKTLKGGELAPPAGQLGDSLLYLASVHQASKGRFRGWMV